MERRDLGRLALVVSGMVVIDALTTPVILLAWQLFPEAFGLPFDVMIGVPLILVKLPTMFVFGRWMYLAGCNLVAAGYADLEFSPASRIWWFAVPVACFFKPFQAMRELWNASQGNSTYTEGSSLVATWWALWLLNGAMAYIGVLITGGEMESYWAQAAADIALAIAAVLLVRGITDAQKQLMEPHLTEIFA